MSINHLCRCGHHQDTHYKDPQTGARYACLGLRCDCERYDEGTERKMRVLPENNYDERKTAYGGGRPHIDCRCIRCQEWEYENLKRDLDWWSWSGNGS